MRAARAPVRVESTGIGPRRRWIGTALLALFPILAISSCALAALVPEMSYEVFLSLLVPAFVLPPIGALVVWFLDRASRQRPGAIDVADGRVTISKNGRTESIAVSDLESGWYVPADGRLELRRKGGPDVSALLAAHDAESVLLATGLDASQRALTLPLRGTIGTPVRALLAAVFGIIPSVFAAMKLTAAISPDNALLTTALWFVFNVAIVAATAKWLGSPRVVIGADGLTEMDALEREFVPYGEIVSLEREASYYANSNGMMFSGLVVRLRNGSALRLPLVGQSESAITTLIARIESAMKTPPPLDGAASLELLARNGRSLADWRRDIEAVIRAPESYRRVRISREDLQAALEDSKASAEHRVTAALALSVLGGEDAPARIRVAADATASAPVRVALQQLANGDVDESALVAAIDEDAKARRPG